jgi:MraZ protein
VLRGLSAVSLDAKGRLSIPSRYRERLRDLCDGRLVLTIDRERCLLIYPLPEWQEVERRLVALSSTNKKARSLKRLLLGHAEECELDGQGRFLVPVPLREFAGLDKRVMLVGQGNKFELWDEQAWQALREDLLGDWDGDSLSDDLESLAF